MTKLEKELSKIQDENEELRIEKDVSDKMRLDAVKKHDEQLKALNLNLSTLRNELKSQTEKFAQYESNYNAVKSENLELEAKLSNCVDERNDLLERCLTSEKLCEQMKAQNIEYKRKYEDAESALHELGREHQFLQVQNHKKISSKWVDDSEVNDCTHCHKQFSVTIRKVISAYSLNFLDNKYLKLDLNLKHHCRMCGQVFCHECSDNTASISSNKKPQRVCKACYIELNN
jgi:hypothetical protein